MVDLAFLRLVAPRTGTVVLIGGPAPGANDPTQSLSPCGVWGRSVVAHVVCSGRRGRGECCRFNVDTRGGPSRKQAL